MLLEATQAWGLGQFAGPFSSVSLWAALGMLRLKRSYFFLYANMVSAQTCGQTYLFNKD